MHFDFLKSVAFVGKPQGFACFVFMSRIEDVRRVSSISGKMLRGEKLERKLCRCHFAHHTSHVDWPELETGPSGYETGH